MFSKRHKFIFIHIPKTAGTSIENYFSSGGIGKKIDNKGAAYGDLLPGMKKKGSYYYLKDISYAHLPIWRFGEYLDLEDYFKFTFIRNPWDRAVSEYKWRITRGHPFPTTLGDKKNLSFENYVKNALKLGLSWAWKGMKEHFIPQHRFLLIKDTLTVDFIGRFENLDQDFKHVCQKLKLDYKPLSILNGAPGKKYQEYYNEETKEIVGQIYKRDIELFNYRFD